MSPAYAAGRGPATPAHPIARRDLGDPNPVQWPARRWRSLRHPRYVSTMTRPSSSTLVAALACGVLVTTALPADANVEIGGTAGVHVFSENNELGVEDLE